jgi:hypothetical protein
MSILNKSRVALLTGVSLVAFASQALAQPDVSVVPTPDVHPKISEHRKAALKLCTSGIQFASDAYVACMEQEGENP